METLSFLLRTLAIALGLGIARWTSDAVSIEGWPDYVFAVLLLGVFATLLKPILVLLMLPFVVLTLGIGLWVVNALLVKLAAAIIPGFILGGWGAAFWSALWISLFTLVAQALAGKANGRFRRVVVRQRGFRPQTPPRKRRKDDDDVIDI